MKIAVDFDGTCTTHDFPEVGQDIGADSVLRELVEAGHQLILFTMRSGKELKDAVGWFKLNNIPLYGIQSDPEQIVWTSSPKAYAQLYIDDASLGCPLTNEYVGKTPYPKIHNLVINHPRPFVDWKQVREMLVEAGIL